MTQTSQAPVSSLRDINDARTQFKSFHDRFLFFTMDLTRMIKSDLPVELTKVGCVPQCLKPDSEDFDTNKVAHMLNVAQAVMDAAFSLVDNNNVNHLIWIGSKKQTMKSFIDVCWEGCAKAGCTVKPLPEGKGAANTKVEDFASKDALKENKESTAKFLATLAKGFSGTKN